jgi:hypothetical protein
MSEPIKQLRLIAQVKEPHRRRQMMEEWITYWIDTVVLKSMNPPTAAETVLSAADLKKKRMADLVTQLAFAMVDEDRGACEHLHGPEFDAITVTLLRIRRKTHGEAYRAPGEKAPV